MPPVHCCNSAVSSQLGSPRLLKLQSCLRAKTVTRPFSVSAFSKQEEGELGITGDKKGLDGTYTCVSVEYTAVEWKNTV